jgi:fatty acid-binding protein DegV
MQRNKTRGKKAAEKLMHDKLIKDGLSLTRDFMFGHINCSESLETFINKSLTYISDVNGNVGVSSIGCSVGTHVGPGTYGIAYVEAAESGMNRESIVKTA